MKNGVILYLVMNHKLLLARIKRSTFVGHPVFLAVLLIKLTEMLQ
jgi:hypothetical protein